MQEICRRAGISASTLYRWKALFLTHKALWLETLEDMELSAGAFLEGMDGTLLREFCRKFLFSFLQRPRGASPDLPPDASGRMHLAGCLASHKTGMEIPRRFCYPFCINDKRRMLYLWKQQEHKRNRWRWRR